MTTFFKKIFLFVWVVFAGVANAQTAADGFVAMQLENWDKAITIYTSLTKANPADQTAWLSLGNAYLAKGNQAKAGEAFQSAFNAKPDGAFALIANARIKLLQNDMTVADEQLKKAKKAAKKDMVARRMIGESYMFYKAPGSTKANLTRAEALLKEALEVNTKDYATLMTLGYVYREMPNGGLALQNYEFAEVQEPNNPLPKLMLAKVYKAAKLPEKFLDKVDKAISVAPKWAVALREKALSLYLMRKWEDATQAYKNLVNNGDEVSIEDEMQLANCLFITKDCKGCSELVEKILKKDGSKNYLRRLQAYCDYENGDYKRGLDIMNEYWKNVSPEKVLASDYEYTARLLVKTQGDTTKAVDNFIKAAQKDSAQWKLYQEAAELLYAQKDYCKALALYPLFIDSLERGEQPTALYKYGLNQYFCKDEDSLKFVKAEKIFVRLSELVPTATLGWLWAGKSASKADPTPDEITTDPTKASLYGKARKYYEEYIKVADPVKNKKDLLTVYQYLAYCYFVKVEAEPFNTITQKWMELETDPAKQTTIQEMRNAFGKEQTTPAEGSPTPAPGGGGKGK